jgi:hypothetical protein
MVQPTHLDSTPIADSTGTLLCITTQRKRQFGLARTE